jgi:hypothetical protein
MQNQSIPTIPFKHTDFTFIVVEIPLWFYVGLAILLLAAGVATVWFYRRRRR